MLKRCPIESIAIRLAIKQIPLSIKNNKKNVTDQDLVQDKITRKNIKKERTLIVLIRHPNHKKITVVESREVIQYQIQMINTNKSKS